MKDREEVLEIVRQLNIIDDTLFQKMGENIDFCQEMISTIMGQKIKVKKVVPQNSIKNLQGRSVVLDALRRKMERNLMWKFKRQMMMTIRSE